MGLIFFYCSQRHKDGSTQQASENTGSLLKEQKCQLNKTSFVNLCEQESANWYNIFLDGQKAGFACIASEQSKKQVNSISYNDFTLKRGGAKVQMKTLFMAVENVDGRPVKFDFSMEGSGLNSRLCGKISENVLVLEINNGQNVETKEILWQKEAIIMHGEKLLHLKNKENSEYESLVFSPQTQTFNKRKYKAFDGGVVKNTNGEFRAKGRSITDIIEGIEFHTRAMLDTDFNLVSSETRTLGMNFTQVLTSKEDAKREFEPSDILELSVVEAPAQTAGLSKALAVYYELDFKTDVFSKPPQSIEQKVKKTKNETKLGLTVSNVPIPSVPFKYEGDESEILSFLRSTMWIEDTPLIRELSSKAIGKASLASEAVKKVEVFVSEYIINRSLDVAYASAAATAVSKEGDCTEFALLTAALFRVAKIPARIVNGLVYIDTGQYAKKPVFIGHAWTQVYIDGNWYSVDSAVNGFSTGHLALDYNDGDPSGFYRLQNLIGAFDISNVKVLK